MFSERLPVFNHRSFNFCEVGGCKWMSTCSIELTGPVCVCFQETEAGARRGEPDKREERVGNCQNN